jgi:hypothetical protein
MGINSAFKGLTLSFFQKQYLEGVNKNKEYWHQCQIINFNKILILKNPFGSSVDRDVANEPSKPETHYPHTSR